MTNFNPKKYIIGAILIVPLLHLIFVGLVFLPVFGNFLAQKHRILNIRKFDHLTSIEKVETQMGFVKYYLKKRLSGVKKPIILVMGSSFNYGYCLDETVIYSNLLQKHYPNHLVVNASVVGFSLEGTIGIFKLISELDINISTLIFDTNLLSYTSGVPLPNGYIEAVPRSVPLFFLKNPPLWDSAELMLNECNRTEPREFIRQKLQEKTYTFQDGLVYASQFKQAFQMASTLSKNVIFLIAPFAEEELIHFKIDTTSIKEEAKGYISICENYENITCLNPLFDFEKRYFVDVAHLSITGHRHARNWIKRYIK